MGRAPLEAEPTLRNSRAWSPQDAVSRLGPPFVWHLDLAAIKITVLYAAHAGRYC